MKPKPSPIDEAREFQVHELFFSTTDKRGIIRSGNDVFVRVSGYPEAAMIGQAHNIIRHPDTPRAVFRLIWNHLLQGKAVVGYVKNLAADGRYYWVVAAITPLKNGYLSVRIKPTSALFATVKGIYAEMCRIEREASARGEKGDSAMDASAAFLTRALQAAGYPDYGAFMTAVAHEELLSRDATITAARRVLIADHLPVAGATTERLANIYQNCRDAYHRLNSLYDSLAHYIRLNQDLRAGFASVSELASGIRLVALNTTIKASQLGLRGQCTEVVADFLSRTSGEIETVCDQFTQLMRPAAAGLQSAVFNLAVARLQLEMILLFIQELAVRGRIEEIHGNNLDMLQSAFDSTIDPAVEALHAIEGILSGLRGHSEDFTKLILNLEVAQTTGAIEASRLTEDDTLRQTFADLRKQADGCRSGISGLEDTLGHFEELAADSPEMIRRITAAIQSARRSVKEFVALLSQNKAEDGIPAAPPDAEQPPAGEPAPVAVLAAGA